MTTQKIILDTGPIVAFLNRRDQFHEWTVTQFKSISPPFLTCEAVLSEAFFMLQHIENGVPKLLNLLERKLLVVHFHLEEELSAVIPLLDKYKNIPMSLADSCLVRMTEQINNSIVCTLDRDFTVYRKYKRKVIPTLMPDYS